MIQPATILEIPIEAWTAADFTTVAAKAAFHLAGRLSGGTNTIEEITVRTTGPLPLEPTEVELTTSLRFARDSTTVSVSVSVKATLRDGADAELASITVAATSRWRVGDAAFIDMEAVALFALSFGALEPTATAARGVQAALAVLGVDAAVVISSTQQQNSREVTRVADLPSMDAADATPLNPFAMIGVAGDEAMRWEALEFPASMAEPWVIARFTPEEAVAWADLDFPADEAAEWRAFPPEEAADWRELEASPGEAVAWQLAETGPHQAERFAERGYDPQQVTEIWDDGVHPDDLFMLLDLVPVDEMRPWIDAIEDHVMMEVQDVRTLVSAGVSMLELDGVPEGLTAGEAIRFLSGDLDESHDDWE